MATYRVVYWRDIPSMVQVSDGSRTLKVGLSPRFQELIDAVAMREGLAAQDLYLTQWRTGPREEQAGSPEEVAAAVAGRLEEEYEGLKQRLLSPGAAGQGAG